MAISFAEWYRQYANANPNSAQLTPQMLEALSNNVTNTSFEIGFGRLRDDLGRIGTGYNNARNTLAQNTRSSANLQGLADTTDVSEASRTAGNDVLGTTGAVTYKVRMGPDGRAYRQAFLNTAANVGARSWGGSDDKAQQWTARQGLNLQKSQMLDTFTNQQNKTVTDQGTDEGSKMGEIAQNVSDYSQWKIDNTPNSPAGLGDAPAAAGGEAPAADAPASVPANGVIWRGGASPNKSTIDALVKNRYGGRKYEIRKRGGGQGYVVVLV